KAAEKADGNVLRQGGGGRGENTGSDRKGQRFLYVTHDIPLCFVMPRPIRAADRGLFGLDSPTGTGPHSPDPLRRLPLHKRLRGVIRFQHEFSWSASCLTGGVLPVCRGVRKPMASTAMRILSAGLLVAAAALVSVPAPAQIEVLDLSGGAGRPQAAEESQTVEAAPCEIGRAHV